MLDRPNAVPLTAHSRFARGLIAAFVLTAMALVCGCSFNSKPTAKGVRSAAAQHVVSSSLVVVTRNGSVEVVAEAARSDVRIEATIVCEGDTQQQADERLAQAGLDVARDTSHVLTIKPVFPGGTRGNDGASFVIHVPDAEGIDVTSSNGSITVKSLKGPLSLHTSNASVHVHDHVGVADLHSSNGSITIKNLVGDLRAVTSNAPVNAAGVKGKADVDTSNGSITLVLDESIAGPITLDTSNASIKVTVGQAIRGDASLDTSNGSILIVGDGVNADQSGKTQAVVHLGADGEKSIVKTSNGSITFTVAK